MSAPLRVTPGASLRGLNTFGVDARAKLLVELDDESDLDAAIRACGPSGPELILGAGSNLLITRPIERAVLRLTGRGIVRLRDDGEQVEIEVLGGTPWHDLVLWSLEQQLQGLENLALIPGTVGAAPIQNIGAYGAELSGCLTGLTAVDLGTGERRDFSREDCALGYRSSVFKTAEYANWLILRVRFRLSRSGRPNIGYGELRAALAAQGISTPTARQVAEAVIAIRTRKLPDPQRLGNAGSFFKNPIVPVAVLTELQRVHPDIPHYPAGEASPAPRAKLSAAWLIERCGWKGHREGDAGVYAGHSLILVNLGQASGSELLALAHKIAESVRQRFGVELEIEPRVI